MTFRTHIKRIAEKCFYQLRQLRTMRGALILDISKAVVHAFVFSRVEYCNSIFSLVSVKHLHPLQSVMNAARVISRRRKYDHISDVVRELHWLSPKELNTSCAVWSTNFFFTSWHRSTLSRCAYFRAAEICVLLLVVLLSN